MPVYLTLSPDITEKQLEELREQLFTTFTYTVNTKNDLGDNFVHYMEAYITDYAPNQLGANSLRTLKVDALEKDEEDGTLFPKWEQWRQAFTEFCNGLIEQKLISHWRWHNHPWITWDNKQDGDDESISSNNYKEGVCHWQPWKQHIYYKQPKY